MSNEGGTNMSNSTSSKPKSHGEAESAARPERTPQATPKNPDTGLSDEQLDEAVGGNQVKSWGLIVGTLP
jgi:hypothetical protein